MKTATKRVAVWEKLWTSSQYLALQARKDKALRNCSYAEAFQSKAAQAAASAHATRAVRALQRFEDAALSA